MNVVLFSLKSLWAHHEPNIGIAYPFYLFRDRKRKFIREKRKKLRGVGEVGRYPLNQKIKKETKIQKD